MCTAQSCCVCISWPSSLRTWCCARRTTGRARFLRMTESTGYTATCARWMIKRMKRPLNLAVFIKLVCQLLHFGQHFLHGRDVSGKVQRAPGFLYGRFRAKLRRPGKNFPGLFLILLIRRVFVLCPIVAENAHAGPGREQRPTEGHEIHTQYD